MKLGMFAVDDSLFLEVMAEWVLFLFGFWDFGICCFKLGLCIEINWHLLVMDFDGCFTWIWIGDS
jgi:hypothetical protein